MLKKNYCTQKKYEIDLSNTHDSNHCSNGLVKHTQKKKKLSRKNMK